MQNYIHTLRQLTTCLILLTCLLGSGCASWRVNGFRKMLVPPGQGCGDACCHGSPICFGHFQTCWRTWPKECEACPPPTASETPTFGHGEVMPAAPTPPAPIKPAPIKPAPIKTPPMKTEEVTEPAPVIDPANEATPETLPEMELLPRGANYPSNLRGTNVKQWFSAAPLSSRE